MTNLIKKNNDVIDIEYIDISSCVKPQIIPKFSVLDAQKLGYAIVELGVNLTILTGFIAVKTLNFVVKTALAELQKPPKSLTNNDNSLMNEKPKQLTKVVTTTTTVTEITYL
jgi:hypothetical protein